MVAGLPYVLKMSRQLHYCNPTAKLINARQVWYVSRKDLHHLLLRLALALDLGDHGLDDTNGNGVTHVTDSETAKRGVGGEGLDAHGLGGGHLDDSGVAGLDHLGVLLHDLAGTAVDLGLKNLELAGDVRRVAIENGSVAGVDLAGVVHDDNLGVEGLAAGSGVVLSVGSNHAALDILDGDVLDVEANVVTGDGLDELLVMHLNGLALGGDHSGGEADGHAGLEDTGLNTANGDCADATDLVDILEGEAEGLVDGAHGGLEEVESLDKDGALVPGHVGGAGEHVVTVPARDGDEGNLSGLVAEALDEGRHLLVDLVVTGLGELDGVGVHLVDANDELLDAEGGGEKDVLTGLAILGDTSLELTLASGDDEKSDISLGGTGDHVLDEITVTRGIDDSEVVLGGLELPESDIDGDTTLTLGLELIKDPGVLEGPLAHLVGLLLELLDGTLVDTAALVDQVTGGGGLANIDVTDDNEVNVSLLLTLCKRWNAVY